MNPKIKLPSIVLFLFLISLIPYQTKAQCSEYTSAYYQPQISKSKCTDTGYIYSGFVTPYLFPAPFTILSVVNNSNIDNSPLVTTSNDTVFIHDAVFLNANYPGASLTIRVRDNCNNIDTIYLSLYSLSNSFYINNTTYSFCDSIIRAPVSHKVNGMKDFALLKYNNNTGEYDTLTNPVTITADSIFIHGAYPESFGNGISFNLFFRDSCDNPYYGSLWSSLENYYNNYAIGGKYECNKPGLQGAVVYPKVPPPYTFIDYQKEYNYPVTGGHEPGFIMGGDSIIINNLMPYTAYYFRFKASCNDTFVVYYEMYDNEEENNLSFIPALAGKTCDGKHSVYIKTNNAADFYNPVIETVSESAFSTIPLTVTAYGDSLVISGFPNKAAVYRLSIRDSACHNYKYIYYEAFANYVDPQYPYFNYIPNDTCGRNAYQVSGVLPGIGPYTFTQLAGPPLTASFNGDTLLINGIYYTVNYEQTELYRFVITDACGKKDTFALNDNGSHFYIYDQINFDAVYQSGGCSGVGNAMAYLKPLYYNQQLHPAPFIHPAVSGPGSPSVIIDSNNIIKISGMQELSKYVITFEDSCGYKFRYNYTSQQSNSDVTVTPSTIIRGNCVKPDNVNGHYVLKAIVKGVSYPYNAYLDGPVKDTILNISNDTLYFTGLNWGTYTLITEDVCNNVNTQLYTLENPGFTNAAWYQYINFHGCDSIKIGVYKTKYFQSNGGSFTDETTFSGPFTAFIVRTNNDTVWCHLPDNSLYSNNKTLEFTFPVWDTYEYNNMLYVVDGCNDTLPVNLYYPAYPQYTQACTGGEMYNKFVFPEYNDRNYNFPLTLQFYYGNIATDNLVSTGLADSLVWNLKVGDYAAYQIFDACGTDLGYLSVNGPSGIYGYGNTRICSYPTDGKHKGNVYLWASNAVGDAPLKYTYVSGPQQVFTDTIIQPSNSFVLINIDTGTYVFTVEEMNDCKRVHTFTVRVEPFIDSIAYAFVPGCLNANKLVTYYYTNYNSSNYNDLIISPNNNIYVWTYNSSFSKSAISGDTIYNVPSGVDLYVSYGCNQRDTVRTPVYRGPQISASAGFSCGTGFSLTVLGARGVQPYRYEIINAAPVPFTAPIQNSNVFTGLPAVNGNLYQVRLWDQCNNAFTTWVRADSVNMPIFTSGFACIGSNYTAYVDSIPNIIYQWTGPNNFVHNGRSFSFNPVTEQDTGLYVLTITSTVTGCTSQQLHSVRLVNCELGVELETNNILCNGTSTGSITANGFGGKLPYRYSWSNGAVTPNLTNITAGTYTLTITDAVDSTVTTSITVTEPDLIILSATVTDASCYGSVDGIIDLSIAGGIPPYEIRWSNNVFVEDQSGIEAGTYTVNVTDSNGCSKQLVVVVEQPELLEVTADITPSGCTNSTGSIELTVTGGTLPYSYNWSNGATGKDLTGLAPGNYTVVITDSNGCNAQVTYDVSGGQPPEMVINHPAPVCGPATVNITLAEITKGSENVAKLNYYLDKGATTPLPHPEAITESGTYFIVGSTAEGCNNTATVNVTIYPQPVVNVVNLTNKCPDNTVDLINSVIVEKGLEYTFYANSGATQKLGSNIVKSSGTYYLVVVNANKCSDTLPVQVTITDCCVKPDLVSKEQFGCSLSSINLTAEGVVKNNNGSNQVFTYKYYTDALAQQELIRPEAVTESGIYYVVGSIDGANCSDTVSVVVKIESRPDVVTVTQRSICVYNAVNLTLPDVTQGSSPGLVYSYFYDAGATRPVGNPGAITSPGVYYIVGTAATGCSDTAAVQVLFTNDQPPVLTGTVPPDKHDINNCTPVAGPTAADIARLFTDDCGGQVYGTKDSSTVFTGCSWTTVFTYIIFDNQSNRSEPVVITYSGADTTPPVIQNIPMDAVYSCGEQVPVMLPLPATDNCDLHPKIIMKEEKTIHNGPGDYVLVRTWTAVDACGNTDSAKQIITVRDALAPQIINCANPKIAISDLNCGAAVPAFTGDIRLTDNCKEVQSALITQTPAAGTVLGVGVHLITIVATDASGNADTCTTTFTVTDKTPPVITRCAPPVVYELPANVCSSIIPDVVSSINVNDNCTPLHQLTITQYPAAGTIIGYGKHTITITVTDAAGNSAYCGTTVEVKDIHKPVITCGGNITGAVNALGCIASVPVPVPTMSDNCGVAILTWVMTGATTGQSAANGINYIDHSMVFNPGVTYVVYTVFDYSGNSNSCSFTVSISASNVSVSAIAAAACPGGNGNVIITATGGKAPYLYSINNNAYQNSNSFNVPAGQYTITVKDVNGCTAVTAVTVYEGAGIIANATVTHISCNDPGVLGSITVTAANGQAPYQYSINGGNYQSSNVFTGLSAGQYTVRAKDSRNCNATLTVTIQSGNTVRLLELAAFPVQPVCNGELGSITTAARFTGGAGNLIISYNWYKDGVFYSSSPNLLNVVPGNYRLEVKVTDEGSPCVNNYSTTTVITAPEPITASAGGSAAVLVNSSPAPVVIFNAAGGTMPYMYTYSLNGGAEQTISGGSTVSIVQPTGIAGTYNYRLLKVTDAAGCWLAVANTSATVVISGAVIPLDTIPDVSPVITILPAIAHGPSQHIAIVDVHEVNGVATRGLISVYVSKDDKIVMDTRVAAATNIGGISVQNNAWILDAESNPSFYIFTTQQIIPGFDKLSFGYPFTLTPGQRRGKLQVSATIKYPSGGENRLNNNVDAESIDYFIN